MKIDLILTRHASSRVPEKCKEACPTGDEVFFCVALVGLQSHLDELERMAHLKTFDYPEVGNDIYRQAEGAAESFRVVHALEHLLVLKLVEMGRIILTAQTVTAQTWEVDRGDPIRQAAVFWLHQGLMEMDEIQSELEQLLKELRIPLYK